MDWIVCLQCLYVKTLISNVTILGDWAFKEMVKIKWGFPGGTTCKEHTCQCRGHKRRGFDPCVRRIPWGRKWQTTPVFLPGKSHGQRSLGGLQSTGLLSWTQLSDWAPKVKWISKGGALIQEDWHPSRKRKRCQERVCTEEMPCEAIARREPSARWEGSEALPETNAVSTLVLDFSLWNCKKVNLCCLRPPVCDNLSQQPKKTNWDSLMT